MGYSAEKKDYELIKEGDYECVIEAMEIKKLPSGKEKLSVKFKVRADVEQEAKNRVIYDDIWREKDSPEHFNRRRINNLLGTQKDIDDGQLFETIDDVIDKLTGACCIAHITIVEDDYRGCEVNTISYFKSSKAVAQTLGGVQVKIDNTTNITDDDIPF